MGFVNLTPQSARRQVQGGRRVKLSPQDVVILGQFKGARGAPRKEKRKDSKMFYDLNTQAGRINFDQMAYNAGTESMRELDGKTAAGQEPEQYAEFSFDEWFDVDEYVSDAKEARARYIEKFAEAVQDWQAETL
jgi:hypothetical protein